LGIGYLFLRSPDIHGVGLSQQLPDIATALGVCPLLFAISRVCKSNHQLGRQQTVRRSWYNMPLTAFSHACRQATGQADSWPDECPSRALGTLFLALLSCDSTETFARNMIGRPVNVSEIWTMYRGECPSEPSPVRTSRCSLESKAQRRSFAAQSAAGSYMKARQHPHHGLSLESIWVIDGEKSRSYWPPLLKSQTTPRKKSPIRIQLWMERKCPR
jgi:hypothetical protein